MKIALLVAGGAMLASAPASALSPKEVYKKAGPAVVLILGSDGGKAGSAGTGSIITPDGKVITNAHVVINEQGNPFRVLYIFLKPPRITGDNAKDLTNRYKCRVLSYSPADELDLALVEIVGAPGDLPTIPFGNPGVVEIGDDVVAIGHPERGGLWTLTKGNVSTMIANFAGIKGKNVFQSDVSINRGNSGGPMLNDKGHIIGVNTMIARVGAGGVAITGVNFSLKSSVAVKWLAGQGMGLAYAPKPEEQQMVVAVAPSPKPGRSSGSSTSSAKATSQVTTATPVNKPPAATIVVAEPPPKKPEEVHKGAATLGKVKQKEKVEAGEKLDPKKAKPKILTKRRPFSMEELRKKQMKELEDMMDEMKGVIDRKRGGGGIFDDF